MVRAVSHPAQMAFFAEVIAAFPEHFARRVLDVGSADVNGGPHRLLADPAHYVGIDLAPYGNVDVVTDAATVAFPTGWFDVTMSSECFEHAERWRDIVANMVRMTSPGGLVVISAAGTGRNEHGTSRSPDGGSFSPGTSTRGDDWYRNLTAHGVRRALRDTGVTTMGVHLDRRVSDLYAVGLVGPVRPDDRRRLDGIIRSLRNRPGPNRWPRGHAGNLVLRTTGDRGMAAVARWRGRRHQ